MGAWGRGSDVICRYIAAAFANTSTITGMDMTPLCIKDCPPPRMWNTHEFMHASTIQESAHRERNPVCAKEIF